MAPILSMGYPNIRAKETMLTNIRDAKIQMPVLKNRINTPNKKKLVYNASIVTSIRTNYFFRFIHSMN